MNYDSLSEQPINESRRPREDEGPADQEEEDPEETETIEQEKRGDTVGEF
jgi:hypothetical protein